MPPKFLNSAWCMAIIAIAIGVISFFLFEKVYGKGYEPELIATLLSIVFFLGSTKINHDREMRKDRKEENDKLLEEIKKRATKEYVDQQDDNIINRFNQHLEESRESDRKEMELIKSMDTKLTSLYNKLIKL